jgi:hypothetical protein
VLVFPRSYAEGWQVDLHLDSYGPTGPGSISVRVCYRGITPSVDPTVVPLRVLVFR